jgi:hypothetical protein
MMTDVPPGRTSQAYDFALEAQRIVEALKLKGATMTLICALREAFDAGLRSAAPQDWQPAAADTWLQVIHAIAVEAMTAQSDPTAEAQHYRKALIGICNMALKAQDVLRAAAVDPSPARIGQGADEAMAAGLADFAVVDPPPDTERPRMRR